MIIYHYHPVTGEYLSQSEARESPLEPSQPLIPAYATASPPPKVPAHHAALWDGAAWSVIRDYRGASVCAIDDAGVYVGQIELLLGEQPSARRILADPPVGLAKPRWDGHAWVDGRSVAEIEADRVAQVEAALEATDAAMPRPLEDLMDVLQAKGVIAPADLPVPVREVLSARKALRDQIQPVKVK